VCLSNYYEELDHKFVESRTLRYIFRLVIAGGWNTDGSVTAALDKEPVVIGQFSKKRADTIVSFSTNIFGNVLYSKNLLLYFLYLILN